MARAIIIKKQDRCFVELPKEFLANDEVELFALRDGYYLLSQPLESRVSGSGSRTPKTQNPKPETEGASPQEIAVLQKLQSIQFKDRTPANVAKMLGEAEKAVLAGLEKKKWVNVFIGNKYKDGVYNIADDVYPMLKNIIPEAKTQNPRQETENRKPETGNPKQETQNPKPDTGNRQLETRTAPVCKDPLCSLLMKQGFLVIRDTREARELSEKLKTDMKSGLVMGIKGFDGVFYVVTKDYFAHASRSILDALKSDANLEAITQNTKLETDGAAAVLRHLAESGDVIEKKKGIFAAV